MRTAQGQTAAASFTAEPELTALVAPNLTAEESSELLRCINDVRQGRKVFYVRLTNRKVTNTPKRMPETDYRPDPGLAPHAHEGMLVRAPTNKKGHVYLHVLDEARIPTHCKRCGEELVSRRCAGCNHEHGHTRVTMEGILSFKVLGDKPGPLAPVVVSVHAQIQAAQATIAQGLSTVAQGLSQLAQIQNPQQ
jgi:hypothetical protein